MTIMQWVNDLDKLHDAYLDTGSEWFVTLWEATVMAGPPSVVE